MTKISRNAKSAVVLGAMLGAPLLGAPLLGGCTLGPQFSPPAAPTTISYNAPGETSPANVTLGGKVTGAWWQLFRSPELDQLVKQAIAGSPTLDAAKARVTSAQEAVTATTGALYPHVGFAASATREKINTSSFGLTPSVFPLPPNFNVFAVGPSVSYALDIFGGTKRDIERQNALAAYQQHQLNAAYLTLTGNTVMQAIQVAAARAQLQAVSDILTIDRQNRDLVRTERDAGTVPDSDVVIAESQLAADETLRPGIDQQLSVAKHALTVLLGRAPGDWAPPDLNLAALSVPSQIPLSLPSELLHQRPDIAAAEAQLHAASAQIGVATARLYPAITLSAGVSAAALDPGHLFSANGLLWSIAAGLTEPVFDGGTRQAQKREALADFKASAADYQQVVLRAFGQVADLLQALNHDADLLAAQQHALDTASESVRLQRIDYGNGATGIIGLLDAQRQYQQARLGFVRAQAQRLQDASQLFVAMGGGAADADLKVADNIR
jgi:NodT family efflux transporter outer membrane factor (OMF) lipoprotein